MNTGSYSKQTWIGALILLLTEWGPQAFSIWDKVLHVSIKLINGETNPPAFNAR